MWAPALRSAPARHTRPRSRKRVPRENRLNATSFFGMPYPNEVFTAVIFVSSRPKFGTPETTFRGKRVCVTGQVRNYRGKPEIIVSDPSQLSE